MSKKVGLAPALTVRGPLNLSELEEQASQNEPLTVLDTVEELSRDYWNGLQDAVENNAHMLEIFYVLVTRRAMSGVEGIFRQTFMGLTEKPRAEPNTDCWKVNAVAETIDLCWTLPSQDTIEKVLRDKAPGVDPFLKECCFEYERGRINREQTEAARAELRSLASEDSRIQLA